MGGGGRIQMKEEGSWHKNIRGGDAEAWLQGERRVGWYTGRDVSALASDGDGDHVLAYIPTPSLDSIDRAQLLACFENIWAWTELLFSSLQGQESFYRSPAHDLRHPMIFYYAHTAVLYINKLRVAGVIRHGIDSLFETIFETGVDEMTWDDLSKNEMEWPDVREVHQYRRRCYELVRSVIETHESLNGLAGIGQESPLWSIVMGIEHEKIHLETSSVLIRELPLALVLRPKQWPQNHPSAVAVAGEQEEEEGGAGKRRSQEKFVHVPASTVTLGKEQDYPSFGWDNEYGSKHMDTKEFEAMQTLVCNADFLAFVKDGGYQNPQWWSEDGWKWRTFRNAKWPHFWIPDGPAGLHCYKLRLLFEIVELMDTLPAEVNFHEAKAYCAWKGAKDCRTYRLITEAEHSVARGVKEQVVDPAMACSEVRLKNGMNGNLKFGSPSSVDAYAPSDIGLHDLFGNVWEWCEDTFCALPGFAIHRLYDDFSTPCYDGQHHLIMGGSFMSCGDLISKFARYHFRPHFHQHAGFRLICAKHLVTTDMDAPPPYAAGWIPRGLPGQGRSKFAYCKTVEDGSEGICLEEDSAVVSGRLATTLLNHFGTEEDFWGPQQELWTTTRQCCSAAGSTYYEEVARIVLRESQRLDIRQERVLEVGCSVGRTSFELAKLGCEQVIGVDIRPEDIGMARQLQQGESIRVWRRDEVPDKGAVVAIEPDTSPIPTFRQMDPCCLQPDLGEFDTVVLNDIIDKVPSPMSLLSRMGGARALVRTGGLLIVSSSYRWDEAVTPRGSWLSSDSKSSFEVLCAFLEDFGFQFSRQYHVPLVKRSGVSNTFCTTMIHVTLWQQLSSSL